MLLTDATRDLIQRLTDALDHLDCHYNVPSQSALIAEAHDYLAQPEPQGPSDEELANTYWKAWHEHLDRFNPVCHAAGLRAVLARWGRPAIKPVPVSKRLPGEGDCDPSFQCWWFTPSEEKWILWPVKWAGPECSHWLPHHALPVPTTRREENLNG